MSEREHDFIDYIKDALNFIEGSSTNIFLLKQDLERIIEWKTERDQFKEAFKKQALYSGELKDKIRAASELVAKIPTLEQAATEMAKELGIKEKYLAPDGMAETKYYELIEAWKKRLEVALGGKAEKYDSIPVNYAMESDEEMKIIKVKLPTVFEVVDDEEMMETIKEGKYIIIAIPVEDILIQKESEK